MIKFLDADVVTNLFQSFFVETENVDNESFLKLLGSSGSFFETRRDSNFSFMNLIAILDSYVVTNLFLCLFVDQNVGNNFWPRSSGNSEVALDRR